MQFLSVQLSNKEDKKVMTEIFRTFDKNSDGILSKEELIQGYT